MTVRFIDLPEIPLTDALRQSIYDRDGRRCAACGREEGLTIQHRKNRGSGGTDRFNGCAFLLTLCGGCNLALENDATFAKTGRRNGWKIGNGDDPAAIEVYYAVERAWFLLDAERPLRVPARGSAEDVPEDWR